VRSPLPLSTTMRSSQKATLARQAAMFAASFLVMMIALNFTAAPGELSSETDSDDGQELRSVKNASAPSF
jgi:preprotein translocase subunit SecG